jgi:hypothetical protein
MVSQEKCGIHSQGGQEQNQMGLQTLTLFLVMLAFLTQAIKSIAQDSKSQSSNVAVPVIPFDFNQQIYRKNNLEFSLESGWLPNNIPFVFDFLLGGGYGTHTPFSVSSVLGLLALLGVSVETAVILVSYINKLRLEGMDIRSATREASLLRLRPIMMTALVACLGLLPAALSTGIGSDTQRPFAIVIVAGLISRLFIGFFVNPVLYEMVAREGDVLQV